MKKQIIAIYRATPAGKQEANLMKVRLLEKGNLIFDDGETFSVYKVKCSQGYIHFIGVDSLYRICSSGKFFPSDCRYKIIKNYEDFEPVFVKKPRILKNHSWEEVKSIARKECYRFAS